MKVHSLGFGSKVNLSDHEFIPDGCYKVVGGLCLPTTRFSEVGVMRGNIVVVFISKSGDVYFNDCCDFIITGDTFDFLFSYSRLGVKVRYYCSDNDLNIWRFLKSFDLRPSVIRIDPIVDSQIYDIIYNNLHSGVLKIRKGSDIYKKFGVFLSQPGRELNPFLVSVGNILHGERLIL